MSYNKLSLEGLLNEIKKVSIGAHQRKFCFILGAGASITSGIPSGQALIDKWDKELEERNSEEYLTWKEQLDINDENKYMFYSNYFEKLFRESTDGYNELEKIMEHAIPRIGYFMLAHILSSTSHNIVITTNFDHLLEQAIENFTSTLPLVIGHENLAHYITTPIFRPTIIKIHHDLLFDPQNKEEELEELHENWQKALDIIFSEYNPIFIGYAGNDNTLMDFLTQNSRKFSDHKWMLPYWMIYETEKLDSRIKTFISKANGYLIWHKGFDDVFFQLGAKFNIEIPSKKDFLDNAAKRYQLLEESIEQRMQNSSQNSKTTIKINSDAEVTESIENDTNSFNLQLRLLHRKAVSLYNNRKYQDALPIAKQIAEQDPENALYHNLFGTTLYMLERYEEALTENQQASKLNPYNALYHRELSCTFYHLKNYKEALKEIQEAVKLEPNNASYHWELSRTLYQLEDYKGALKEVEKAVELDPNNASYHWELSRTLYQLEDYERALKEAQKAAELEPDDPYYHRELNRTLYQLEDYKGALKEVQKAAELEPDNALYHHEIALNLYMLGYDEQALTKEQEAVKLEPDNKTYLDSLQFYLELVESASNK